MESGENRLYKEPADYANDRRARQFEQLKAFIGRERKKADERRRRYFQPDFASVPAYEDSTRTYRRELVGMLGWPLAGTVDKQKRDIPAATCEFVVRDALSDIYRLEIETDIDTDRGGVAPEAPSEAELEAASNVASEAAPEAVSDAASGAEAGAGERAAAALSLYGLLFLPRGDGPFPLVIVQHGGQGTPELCAGFYTESNYNDMVRRFLRRGFAVFAPQLHLWSTERGPENNRRNFDVQLKQLGGSITAVEIHKLTRALDYLQARPDVDAERIGMAGLSYGGFYTLFTTAIDTRIRAAYVSCFVNSRFVYDWSDWTWPNSGHTFLDAEVCGLVCPRPLYIESGLSDGLFEERYAAEEVSRARGFYERLGIPQRLKYKAFEGIHEFDKADDGVDFLCAALSADRP